MLEIGTGSGYQAAILAELVAEVYTIEIIPELGEQAARILKSLQYTNICTRIGDGYAGWPEAAPFDGIIVTAAPQEVPAPLQDQLKPGGRLIIPVEHENSGQVLKRLTKGADGTVYGGNINGCSLCPLYAF